MKNLIVSYGVNGFIAGYGRFDAVYSRKQKVTVFWVWPKTANAGTQYQLGIH